MSVLLLLVQDLLLEKRNNKKNLIEVSRDGYDKVIFVLLDEIIIIHVQLALIII